MTSRFDVLQVPRQRRWLGSVVALCLIGLGVPDAVGQSSVGPAVRTPETIRTNRPFGELRSWLNSVDDNRAPIRERPLIEVGQNRRTFAPPRTQQTGFVPRLTVATDFRDNVFFTSSNTESDAVLVGSPGLSFVERGPRWSLLADYSFEAALYARNNELNQVFDAQSGQVFAGIDITPRTRLEFIDVYQDARDPTFLTVPGSAATGELSRSNVVSPSVIYRFDALTTLEARYRNNLEIIETENSTDVTTQDAEGVAKFRFTPQDQAGFTYRFRQFDFDPGDKQPSHTAFASITHEFSETLIADASFGGTYIEADSNRVIVVGKAAVRTSIKNAIFSLEYNRGVSAAGGIDAPLLSNTAGGRVKLRMGPGLWAEGSVDYLFLETLNAAETNFDILEANAQLSYAILDNLWFRVRYNFIQQITDNADPVNSQRIILSFTVSK